MNNMKALVPILALLALYAIGQSRLMGSSQIEKYNIAWDSPSKDSLGSMPLGNGDIGLNVWVEESGDLLCYLSKTDSWGDNARLLKVGKVRVKLSPSLPRGGSEFSQVLDLKTGTIKVRYGDDKGTATIRIWVDANHPVIQMDVESEYPLEANASIELWRTERHPIASISHGDVMFNKQKENGLQQPVIIEPDVVLENLSDRIGWYHHNSKSVGPKETAIQQGLLGLPIRDPLLHRTFGAVIEANNGIRIDKSNLASPKSKSHRIRIHARTQHPSTPEAWLRDLDAQIQETNAIPLDQRRTAHEDWWAAFWDRSWIDITHSDTSMANDPLNDEAFIASRGYALQRFISACAGRGKYPIKFNGSIFNVAHEGKPEDADYRRWGPAYWWQNTRLPYISMCASGDFDHMKPLFQLYVDDLMPFLQARTERYMGHSGAFISEEIYIWGGIPMATYGWESTFNEREDKLQTLGYHKYEWVSGLELVFMMLNYYEYTQDEDFLQQKALPTAHEILIFFDEHYRDRDENGEMVMYPAQALETWWDSLNPMPELAGLYAVTDRLNSLPDNLTSETQRAFWKRLNKALPEIPLREVEGVKMLAPAERYDDKHNKESPELYAVFPFRLFGVGKPNIEYGREAMKHQWTPAVGGWSQEDIFYAYLGDAAEAKRAIVARSKGFNAESRFPAFWGPNFDWLPDQDHGGVLMKAIQSLILQVDGTDIYLLPAWPKDWNASFKLNAPYATTVQARIVDGEIYDLEIHPKERAKDLVIVSE